MKYIRAQNGMVLSVSQLIPPAKGSRHDALSQSDIEVWRLNAITVDGQRHTYAVYTDMEHAISVFSNSMVSFIYGQATMILFGLGENEDPRMGEDPDGRGSVGWVDDGLDPRRPDVPA
jgi:hypothetical protein